MGYTALTENSVNILVLANIQTNSCKITEILRRRDKLRTPRCRPSWLTVVMHAVNCTTCGRSFFSAFLPFDFLPPLLFLTGSATMSLPVANGNFWRSCKVSLCQPVNSTNNLTRPQNRYITMERFSLLRCAKSFAPTLLTSIF